MFCRDTLDPDINWDAKWHLHPTFLTKHTPHMAPARPDNTGHPAGRFALPHHKYGLEQPSGPGHKMILVQIWLSYTEIRGYCWHEGLWLVWHTVFFLYVKEHPHEYLEPRLPTRALFCSHDQCPSLHLSLSFCHGRSMSTAVCSVNNLHVSVKIIFTSACLCNCIFPFSLCSPSDDSFSDLPISSSSARAM